MSRKDLAISILSALYTNLKFVRFDANKKQLVTSCSGNRHYDNAQALKYVDSRIDRLQG